MKFYKLFNLALLIASQSQAMVIHEWGTFTSVQGSDGIDHIGAYKEDEKLPSFVHGFGEVFQPTYPEPPFDPGCFKNINCRVLRSNQITQRMETPVIYFYSDKDYSESVRVNVKFPEGVISETYPAPVTSYPSRGATILENGEVNFEVDVLPQRNYLDITIPFVEDGNIYKHARNVNSNTVLVGPNIGARNHEAEKFIFYRGVGKFKGPLMAQGTLVQNHEGDMTPGTRLINLNPRDFAGGPIRSIMLLHVDKNHEATYQFLPIKALTSGQEVKFNNDFIHSSRVPRSELKAALVSMLENEGLFHQEAQAMVDTWEHGYFETPGMRVLYVLPRENTETILPMTVTPVPQALVRVMVGRLEVVTEGEEYDIASRFVYNESPDFNYLGRFLEPKVRAAREFALSFHFKPEVIARMDQFIENLAQEN